ncbi:MAG: DUF4115 domain-containing protein [Firmicutes bacterium]|nr:DUF4115 domain-containing protein [Bacillota bacterium]
MEEIGRRLKARREELGLTLEQAQAETKIRRRYLEALEAGNDQVIPGEVYVKGFLRFYANFLGLDGTALVQEYKAWKEGQASAPVPEPPGRGPERGEGGQGAGRSPEKDGSLLRPAKEGRRGLLGRLFLSVFVVLALVAAGATWYVWSQSASPSGTPDSGGPGAEVPPGGTGQVGEGAADSAGGGDRGPTGEGAAWALTSESAALARYVVYGTPFTVSLEVTAEKCWVQATVDGRVVLESTLEAGARTEWTARETVTLVLGRPHLVRIGVGGRSLGPGGAEDKPRTLEFRWTTPPGTGSGGEGQGNGGT